MAKPVGIAVSSSRFACLKIEDDDEEEKKPALNKPTSQQSGAGANKKKNKKKKDQKETEQLKNLAFGKGGAGGPVKQKNGSGDVGGRKTWDQWREHDNELVEEQFKDDLALALLQSRLEAEQKEQEDKLRKERIEAGLEVPQTREGRKKKKQKEKPQPMSLDQFKQLPPEKPPASDSEDEVPSRLQSPPVQTRVPSTQQDPTFFNTVKDDTEQILRQEKMQEEYRKQFASENVIVAKLRSDLEAKDTELLHMKEQLNSMHEELKQVKKRNKQLCVILAQGEMKDKAQVLVQVDELTAVKDELTEQVTTLTAELEKEKSKNHALKAELDKFKASRHGK